MKKSIALTLAAVLLSLNALAYDPMASQIKTKTSEFVGALSACENVQACLEILDGTVAITGPLSATDNAVPRFDGVTGRLLQTSLVLINDSNLLTAPGGVSAGTTGRITFLSSGEYIDGATDDYYKFQGVAGSDNTDLRLNVDGLYPILDSVTDTTVAVADILQLGVNGAGGRLRFYAELGATDRTFDIIPSASQAANIVWTAPAAQGASTTFLQNDGSGNLSWVAVSGVTPSSGDVTGVGNCASGLCFGGGGGNELTLASDFLKLTGLTEDITVSLATADSLIFSSSTGITGFTMPWTWTMQNGGTIGNTVNNRLALGEGSEDMYLDFGTADQLTIGSNTGADRINIQSVIIRNSSSSANFSASGTFTGTAVAGTKTLSSGSDGGIGGGSFSAVKSIAGSSSSVNGLTGSATFSGSGTQTSIAGLIGTGTKSGSGTLTNFYGVRAVPATVSAGTLTNNYALSIEGKVTASGTPPTLSSCGSSPTITGAKFAGKITVGTGTTTSCTATFAEAYPAAPVVVVTGSDTAVNYSVTSSTTAFVVTSNADMDSDVINYAVVGI